MVREGRESTIARCCQPFFDPGAVQYCECSHFQDVGQSESDVNLAPAGSMQQCIPRQIPFTARHFDVRRTISSPVPCLGSRVFQADRWLHLIVHLHSKICTVYGQKDISCAMVSVFLGS